MSLLMLLFKGVSLIFAASAVFTGVQAILDPVGFSRSFGIPLINAKRTDTSEATNKSYPPGRNNDPTMSYVSLMGVRQLATGLTIMMFALQGKWMEIATILSILGTVVACTDGYYLARAGNQNKAKFHAIPGALISLLASKVVLGSL